MYHFGQTGEEGKKRLPAVECPAAVWKIIDYRRGSSLTALLMFASESNGQLINCPHFIVSQMSIWMCGSGLFKYGNDIIGFHLEVQCLGLISRSSAVFLMPLDKPQHMNNMTALHIFERVAVGPCIRICIRSGCWRCGRALMKKREVITSYQFPRRKIQVRSITFFNSRTLPGHA